jgi:hypothetical protein
MRWLFRRKPTQEERYQQAITAISKGLFDTSVLLTSQLKEGWASIPGGPVLNKEQDWTIAVEVLWYLLARCDRSLRFTFRVLDVDHVMDDVTERALNEFVSRVVGTASTPEEREHLRKEQLERLYTWKAEADLDYNAPVQRIPLPANLLHATLPENSPLARLIRRVEDAIGVPHKQELVVCHS